jgi:triacylglycerol lipase
MMTFDRGFARLLLEICRYTYATGFSDEDNTADKNDALSWIKKIGGLTTDEPILLNGSKTSVACIASYPDRNIVAYMGTKTQFDTIDNAIASSKDWTQNFEARPVPFKLTSEQLGNGHPQNVDKDNLGGRVHEGFFEELCAVQAKVVAKLLELGGRNRPLFVTGHSQGGAEAALATRALLAGGFSVVSTYTFAAPRPGNLEFTKSIPATLPVHRIEFGDDIVPHLPPTLIGKEAQKIVRDLKLLPFLPEKAKNLLNLVQRTNAGNGFNGLGTLCYGSHKTKALRIDLSSEEEAALFYDRLWSLVRHPERWAEHHHLAGTTVEVSKGIKGNYTALVSDFQIVN